MGSSRGKHGERGVQVFSVMPTSARNNFSGSSGLCGSDVMARAVDEPAVFVPTFSGLLQCRCASLCVPLARTGSGTPAAVPCSWGRPRTPKLRERVSGLAVESASREADVKGNPVGSIVLTRGRGAGDALGADFDEVCAQVDAVHPTTTNGQRVEPAVTPEISARWFDAAEFQEALCRPRGQGQSGLFAVRAGEASHPGPVDGVTVPIDVDDGGEFLDGFLGSLNGVGMDLDDDGGHSGRSNEEGGQGRWAPPEREPRARSVEGRVPFPALPDRLRAAG